MRVLAVTSLCVALILAATIVAARQSAGGSPRRPRIVAELSEMLSHSPLGPCTTPIAATLSPTRTRVASWNIQAARSASVESIAAEMRAIGADVFALQEVDVRTRRGGYVDEPGALAAALGFNYVFAASILWDEGHYGLALLSRWPLVDVRRHRISGADLGEPRIVLDATVCARGRPLRLLNHHADRRVAARALGFADLQQIARAALGRGILFIGDMNEYPDGPGVRGMIDAGLVDLGAGGNAHTTGSGRIDYLLADGPMARLASSVRVWPTDKSDHHAVVADLEW